MNTEELKGYINQRPGWSVRRLASALCRRGVTRNDILRARPDLSKGLVAVNSPSPAVSAPRLKDLSEFRKDHDIPQKIRDRLAKLRADAYSTEDDFRQLCGVPASFWRRNAELPEFSDHKFKHAGMTYWAAKETITQMKRITGKV